MFPRRLKMATMCAQDTGVSAQGLQIPWSIPMSWALERLRVSLTLPRTLSMAWERSNLRTRKTGATLVSQSYRTTPQAKTANLSSGPSSNIAFLRHISLAMARMGDLSQSMPSPSNRARDVAGGMSVSRPHPVEDDTNAGRFGRLHGGVNIYALPSEARTWSLIKEYFQKTGQLLPFVHEETFCATFFKMKRSNFTMARRTWLGLLNIILAMATTLHVDRTISSEKRIEESDVYYQRAIGLCDKESRRNISLELGQYKCILLYIFLLTLILRIQAYGYSSSIPGYLGPVSPRHTKVSPSVDCTWAGHHNGVAARPTVSKDE